MTDLPQLTAFMDAILMPFVGGISLLTAKFGRGDAARWAERQFYVVLVVITIVTLRTVIMCNQVWLIHTTTLGTLIVGALVVPSQDVLLGNNTESSFPNT